jgi:formylglycine-generating enzyme required for sulfatase activity
VIAVSWGLVVLSAPGACTPLKAGDGWDGGIDHLDGARSQDASVEATAVEGPISCRGLARTCGPNADEDCCASLPVPDTGNPASFTLGRGRGDPDDLPCSNGSFSCDPDETPGVPATITPFLLDKFEVTVGRFRSFVRSGFRPGGGSGKHGYLNNGNEIGWDSTWPLPSTPDEWGALLSCDSNYQTWTADSGGNETKPINCLNWYAAYAFCIWDGGFLPSEAEWELAASGGEERVFAWSVPPGDTTIDTTRTNYLCLGDGLPACSSMDILPVGSRPAGDGRWRQSDLIGNVMEWVHDWYAPYPASCDDCIADSVDTGCRVLRGGSFYIEDKQSFLRAAYRETWEPTQNIFAFGVRCARAYVSH